MSKGKSIKLGWFCAYWEPGLFWFRLFGVGLHFKDTSRHPKIFSERLGIQTITLGRWIVGILKRYKNIHS